MNEIVEAKSATFEPWGLKEECGVFGVWGCPDEALPYVILGLHALQHRGQEGVGIVTNDKGDFSAQLDAGLVSDVFSADRVEPGSLPGTSGIGHNRYATSGSGDLANLQPILQRTKRGPLALALVARPAVVKHQARSAFGGRLGPETVRVACSNDLD